MDRGRLSLRAQNHYGAALLWLCLTPARRPGEADALPAVRNAWLGAGLARLPLGRGRPRFEIGAAANRSEIDRSLVPVQRTLWRDPPSAQALHHRATR